MRWCAKEGLIPTLLVSQPEKVREMAEIYVEEAKGVGRELALGESIGVFRSVYLSDSYEESRKLAENGFCGVAFPNFFHQFGFTEAWRFPEDDEKYGSDPLPASECTIDRLEKGRFAFVGTTDDIRREMDALVENANPEWFIWQSDQGELPLEDTKRMLEKFGKEVLPHYA